MPSTNRPLTVAALLLAVFMGAMEATVVTTAMPTVVADLGGIRTYAWVFTAFVLATAVMIPISGRLADQLGRKPVLLGGIALFLVGSLGCGLSASMPQLITARVVQGLGAGAMQPTSMTIVGDLFAPEERARVQAAFGAVWGVAGLVGPLVGGLVVRLLSWRWVFFLNLPFGAGAVLVLLWAFRERVEPSSRKLDALGAALFGGSMLCLLLAGHGAARWPCLGLGLALVVALVAVERRAREPVLPIDLMRLPAIGVATAVGAIIGGAMSTTLTYLPLYVQGVQGGTPTDAGLAVTPIAIGWPLASAVSGRLVVRFGYRPLIRFGLVLTLLAAVLLALFLRPGGGLAVPRLVSFVFGLGLGFVNTPLLIAVQTAVTWEQRGAATASAILSRMVGAVLAVGATGGVLVGYLTRDPLVSADAANELLGPGRGRSLDPHVLLALSSSLRDGLSVIFWVVVALAAAALLAGLRFPRMSISERPRRDDVHAPDVPAAGLDEP
jgi:EmrB/QacA subfamily drug resistance transporter